MAFVEENFLKPFNCPTKLCFQKAKRSVGFFLSESWVLKVFFGVLAWFLRFFFVFFYGFSMVSMVFLWFSMVFLWFSMVSNACGTLDLEGPFCFKRDLLVNPLMLLRL